MLIRFNVKNFLSFNETENGKSEEFSMIAGKVRSKSERVYDDGNIKLLKLATIFGANASGKSNFVKAIDFMKYIVIFGLPKIYSDTYCKIDLDNQNKASYFELEIKLADKYYSYGFEIVLSRGTIMSEWLFEINKNEEKLIFSRDIDKGFDFGEEIKKSNGYPHLRVYSEDIKDDNSILFLSIMNQNKSRLYSNFSDLDIFKSIYEWIGLNLKIVYPNNSVSAYLPILRLNKIEEIGKILSALGTGIKNIKKINVKLDSVLKDLPNDLKREILADIEGAKITISSNKNIDNLAFTLRNRNNFYIIMVDNNLNVNCETIKFSHENKDVLFNISEESDGTVRIIDLVEILLSEENITYVIDELDRCLHPSLSYKFINEFANIAKKKNIQLIVTTHESRLLDFDLLRRDEIWFVDKNFDGASRLYSLDEYNERFDKKIDKSYLDGRYGAVPIFDTVFPIGEA